MDPRFAKLQTDPRFVRPKASKNKVVLDERFKQLFDEEAEPSGKSKNKKNKVDKYGRPLETTAKSNELKRYYRLEEAAAEAAPAEVDLDEDEEEAEEEDEEEDELTLDEPVAADKFIDRARGGGADESSEEDSDDSDSEGSVTLASASVMRRKRASPSRSPSIDLSESGMPEMQEDSDDEPEVEPTKRVAVVNMDWDHLRALDLYRVLASSLSATALPAPAAPRPSKNINKKFDADGEEIGPYKAPSRLNLAQGRLLSLKIYPSSFGRERMEKEAIEGPPRAVFASGRGSDGEGDSDTAATKKKRRSKSRKSRKQQESESESDDDEVTERDLIREQLADGDGEDYDGEALRKYQLERLRYYYAVATFDSVEAASHVYGEIDGTEFERTANVFDLQFVPDETSFEGDPVHDEATESTIAAAGPDYQGLEFVTDALRHSKVTLTWDADDPHRKSKIAAYLAQTTDFKGKGKGKGKGVANPLDDDILAYLASSSDEDEDVEDAEGAGDDFFEASSALNAKKVAPVKGSRESLRNLFGLDGTSSSSKTNWDGSKASKKGASGMEITFTPALTDKGGDAGEQDDDRDESALETYKRKERERKERKKLERKAKRDGVVLPPVGEEGPEFGGEDVGAGGFDDDFFAGGDDDDAFAAFDAGDDLGADGRKKVKDGRGGKVDAAPKLSKRAKREAKEAQEESDRVAQASLALLIDSDSDDDPERAGKHFDMRAILKAERNAGKKLGRGKKSAKADVERQDEFVIDVKDDRFKAVYEDSNLAIDPTNPRFLKSRNMDALLSEGQKQRSKKREARAPVSAASLPTKNKVAEVEDWRKLAEAVKRKAGDVGGRGKRAKPDNV